MVNAIKAIRSKNCPKITTRTGTPGSTTEMPEDLEKEFLTMNPTNSYVWNAFVCSGASTRTPEISGRILIVTDS